MELAENTRSIIELAWARTLGLGDSDLLGGASSTRREVVRPDGAPASFLRLFDHSILSAPAEILSAARGLDDAELSDERRLLQAMRSHGEGARIVDSAALLYAEEPPALAPSALGAVSFSTAHVQAVLEASPADDVHTSGLSQASWSAAVVEESSGDALAASGREVWQGMLAHLGVLTVPPRRGRGLGRHIAGVAAEEAFTEGLIPQWRAGTESPGSLRIALSLGFTRAGTQTTVSFD